MNNDAFVLGVYVWVYLFPIALDSIRTSAVIIDQRKNT